MNKLTRYIIKTVLYTTAIVVIALISMDFFIQLISEFSDIGDGGYGLNQALYYVLLNMPNDVYQLFPIAGLIGCLLGLGLLASHSELVVMRAAGMSVMQISAAVMVAIILMVSLVTALGEFVAPKTIHFADNMKAIAKSGGQAVATQQGVWLRDNDKFIHIEQVQDAAKLKNIYRYTFNAEHQLVSESYAKNATYQNHTWVVTDIEETDFNNGKVSTTNATQETWDMQLNPTLLKMAQVEPYEMNLVRLYQYVHYQKHNKLEYQSSALNFWQRVFQPFGTCVMLFLAIPFIFGPLRSVTMGLRLVSGVVVGFSFYILNQFFGPFSLVYDVPPFVAALLPSLLFAIIGLLLMRRVK